LLTATAESVRITTVQQEIQELSTPCHRKNFFSLLHFYFSFDVKHFVGLSAAFSFSATNTLNGTLSTEQEREGNEEGKKTFDNKK